MRETGDPVETEGVRRARARAAAADLVLWVADASAGERGAGPSEVGEAPGPSAVEVAGQSSLGGHAPAIWLVRNKIDLLQVAEGEGESADRDTSRNERGDQVSERSELGNHTNTSLIDLVNGRLKHSSEHKFSESEAIFKISAVSGEGFDALLLALTRRAEVFFLTGAESALVTRERHRRALQDTLSALRRALVPELSAREDLLAEELRLAAHALGRLTGRVDVEDILDVIFRDFCIGK
jgi:tRNA modification GTPase